MDRNTARKAGFTLCSAMIAALLAGCSGQPHVASANGAPLADAPLSVTGDAIAKAEGRVARSPDSLPARTVLAQAYFAAGRFDSAATTFEDAVALGDRAPRTGLSLALSYIGAGRNAQALEVLGRWHDRIPASDYGLAIALAGRPDDGVTVLSDVVRGGENTPKTRQNLAYAYALGGHWGEARVVASQDVAPEDLDARMGEWATRARPEQSRARLAVLIGAPLTFDPGQPVALARRSTDTAPRMAEAAPVPAPAAAVDATAELPAVVEAAPAFAAAEPAPPVYVAPPVPKIAMREIPARRASGTSVERAFDRGIARSPVAQAAPVKAIPAKAAPAKAVPAKAAPAKAPMARASSGTHLVQLGSFTTMDGARRAWEIFQRRDPALRGHTMRVTEADVNGRRYYRVAAEGFERGAAQSLCSTVKGRGDQCFAYADTRPAPATKSTGGAQLARR